MRHRVQTHRATTIHSTRNSHVQHRSPPPSARPLVVTDSVTVPSGFTSRSWRCVRPPTLRITVVLCWSAVALWLYIGWKTRWDASASARREEGTRWRLEHASRYPGVHEAISVMRTLVACDCRRAGRGWHRGGARERVCCRSRGSVASHQGLRGGPLANTKTDEVTPFFLKRPIAIQLHTTLEKLCVHLVL
jgi:hypothetical protein